MTFHEKPLSGSLAVPRGRTDTQTDVNDEAKSRLFAKFCERAQKLPVQTFLQYVPQQSN